MTEVEIRRAGEGDVPAIVGLLADDTLGATRETVDDLGSYVAAFERLRDDPNQYLLVACRGDEVVGTLQLTIVPGLSRRGSTRAIIEGVRVRGSERGAGLGQRLIEHAIGLAHDEGCSLVQLTTDKSRVDAHRFYERLGFVASHVGYKLQLP
jgi:GNAT superfamily N-acetyltransferase